MTVLIKKARLLRAFFLSIKVTMEFAQPLPQPHNENYVQLKFDSLQIIGKSIAGVETIINIPQLGITFDTGRAPHFAYHEPYLAISHFHLDHGGGLAYYLGLRRLINLPPLKIIVPETKLAAVEDYLHHLKVLSESKLEYQLCTATEPLEIKPHVNIQAITSFHCVTSQGYLLTQYKYKLKKEFLGYTQQQIIELKNKKVVIQDCLEEPLLAFSGDSRYEFLLGPAKKAKFLLMECSFFGNEDDIGKIEKYGHTHIKDWQKHAEQIASEHVIMIHTSQRYTRKEIEQACNNYLPKHLLDRLIVFRT